MEEIAYYLKSDEYKMVVSNKEDILGGNRIFWLDFVPNNSTKTTNDKWYKHKLAENKDEFYLYVKNKNGDKFYLTNSGSRDTPICVYVKNTANPKYADVYLESDGFPYSVLSDGRRAMIGLSYEYDQDYCKLDYCMPSDRAEFPFKLVKI